MSTQRARGPKRKKFDPKALVETDRGIPMEGGKLWDAALTSVRMAAARKDPKTAEYRVRQRVLGIYAQLRRALRDASILGEAATETMRDEERCGEDDPRTAKWRAYQRGLWKEFEAARVDLIRRADRFVSVLDKLFGPLRVKAGGADVDEELDLAAVLAKDISMSARQAVDELKKVGGRSTMNLNEDRLRKRRGRALKRDRYGKRQA